MLAAVKIKEEPLDVHEELQEVLNQQEAQMKQQFSMDIKTDTLHDDSSLTFNNFHIIDEQESIITISAGDMTSQYELQNFQTLKNTEDLNNKFNGVCGKCLKVFTNRGHFFKHTKRNHCIIKQKCIVCPVTFIDTASLRNHLKLHQDNVFFCSKHCGANFKTLPLCEEHELREHKTVNPPKIRYKHFCSFCREGFKTELQLHVHWLQQNYGCGKLMQDVAMHSTNVANNNNNDNIKMTTTNYNNIGEIDKQSTSPSSVSTIPITKLRLKSSFGSSKSPNKRQLAAADEQNDDDDDEMTALKRMKMFNRIKADSESSQLPLDFANDVQIKEEPLDEEENNMAANLIPEVIIKTEEDKPEESRQNDAKPEMKSLMINNMLNPEFNGKIIPLSVQATPNKMPVLKWITNNNNINNASNISNTSLKNLTNLKLVKLIPASIASSNRNVANLKFSTANQQNVNNLNIIPLPKTGLQILKFLPNTQLLSFKTMNQSGTTNKNDAKQPIVIKLQTSTAGATQQNLQKVTVKPINTTSPPPLVPTTWNNPISKPLTSPVTAPSTVSIKLNSLDQNTTIDAEDFKKLQAEALIKVEEHRKNFVISKHRLKVIENLPEKKQLIDRMKKQIAEVELKTEQKDTNTAPKFACAKDTFVSTDKTVPPSLYLPISSKMDVDLVQARCQNPNFIYKFICPYCLTDYEWKRSLKSHLSKAHNLTMRDMEKINVQAKAFKNEEITIEVIPPIKKEDISEDNNDSQSESESMHADTSNSSTTTSPTPIKMSAFKTNKVGYICSKCGRKCSSKTMLNDHISANCSREPQYNCLQCPKKFYSHGTLQCHLTIHTGELPHKCNYCDKRFRTRGQVTVHHRTHTGERPFVCQVCTQRFTHRETLIAHLSRHIGMKRYKCYGCDKHFSCVSALKTHRELRGDTCGKVKFNPRAIGPRVRVIRGNVVFEAQPEFNAYLKSEDPKNVLSELQNQPLKSN